MKKIILPTDFSLNAEVAIDYTPQLFKTSPVPSIGCRPIIALSLRETK
jgi:hypothetical protein